jgi:hypothetical protein
MYRTVLHWFVALRHYFPSGADFSQGEKKACVIFQIVIESAYSIVQFKKLTISKYK